MSKKNLGPQAKMTLRDLASKSTIMWQRLSPWGHFGLDTKNNFGPKLISWNYEHFWYRRFVKFLLFCWPKYNMTNLSCFAVLAGEFVSRCTIPYARLLEQNTEKSNCSPKSWKQIENAFICSVNGRWPIILGIIRKI